MAPETSSGTATLARRLTAQMLSGERAAHPVAVVDRLLAVQGQDLQGARLAIRARSLNLHVSDVDRCLTEERSLLITTLNRGTLHLVRAEDYPWLHLLTAPGLVTGNARRLAQEGVSAAEADRAVLVVERALARDGPQTRGQLRRLLVDAGVPTGGQAFVHIIMRAALRGILVRGPMLGQQHAFVLVGDWLPTSPRIDRDQALAKLARRYLVGHGPATDRDLAQWAGLPLRDVRAGLSAIAAQLRQYPGGLVHLARPTLRAALPPPRLLGQFDPVLLGWASRADIVGEHRELVTVNGLFRPFAVVRGRAVATWSMAGGTVRLVPFSPLPAATARALDADAADVQRFFAERPASATSVSPRPAVSFRRRP
jgi:hypothetical protein